MIAPTELVLLPRPRHLDVTGDGPPTTTEAVEHQATDLEPQGFELHISDTTINLRYRDDAGLRYGRATLAQLRAQFPDRLPALSIKDWPDFATRGYMLDVSRGRVPTRDTLERIVGLLELLRVNHFQLYTEHTFAYTAHETVWRDASPMTPDDIRWLDERCTEAGIELAANQNCFGHFEHWLKHDAYRDRAELAEGFELMGRHRPATTLAPTQDNADFALDLVRELVPNFSSRRVNIGCDETWELGRGVSKAAADAKGKGRVYLEHLHRLVNPLIADGLDVQFWGDIIANHPELATELPQGATAVAWWYEAPWDPEEQERLLWEVGDRFLDAGVDLSKKLGGFAGEAAPFLESSYPLWVAPGTGTWRSLLGRLRTAYGNMLDTVNVGLSGGVEGVLITDWGDGGHPQPPSVTFPPLAYGAALSWCRDANHDLNVPAVLDHFVFPGTNIGAALEALGHLNDRTGQIAFNSSPLQLALEPNAHHVGVGDPDPKALAGVVDDIDALIATVNSGSGAFGDHEIVQNELTAAARQARHGAWRLLRQAGAPAPDTAAMRADLAETTELHRRAWLSRARPGGMETWMTTLTALAKTYDS
ncbi:glycoside hydrolase family 20 zincin-like fold domain-containing protein [Stackebrandtia nassauensis]|uniref:Glycoside hydrolase, family 20, catalytic core n=1 Tax=Stackebrandtia nassauensis (strain DSM 44728 / CIP 108903 / NRRL B-16338 / NBRC 102104 / LLR-40K-21) TaxID=446470 RepID=D3QAG1_STANL|nr:glycoside hydrolase family 20 zincin-like fold domain-containing protein [Stackebrandtia nassauensis]ADD42744.1 Glycoside hydrolase, family 20, catalytic core [Stackebrandtia nassauensis DSM 44728]